MRSRFGGLIDSHDLSILSYITNLISLLKEKIHVCPSSEVQINIELLIIIGFLSLAYHRIIRIRFSYFYLIWTKSKSCDLTIWDRRIRKLVIWAKIKPKVTGSFCHRYVYIYYVTLYIYIWLFPAPLAPSSFHLAALWSRANIHSYTDYFKKRVELIIGEAN